MKVPRLASETHIQTEVCQTLRQVHTVEKLTSEEWMPKHNRISIRVFVDKEAADSFVPVLQDEALHQAHARHSQVVYGSPSHGAMDYPCLKDICQLCKSREVHERVSHIVDGAADVHLHVVLEICSVAALRIRSLVE